jgi:hypothetical protein
MDAVGSVCFFVVVVGTCIVVNGCLDSTIVIVTDNVIIIIIIIIIISDSGDSFNSNDPSRGWQFESILSLEFDQLYAL